MLGLLHFITKLLHHAYVERAALRGVELFLRRSLNLKVIFKHARLIIVAYSVTVAGTSRLFISMTCPAGFFAKMCTGL